MTPTCRGGTGGAMSVNCRAEMGVTTYWGHQKRVNRDKYLVVVHLGGRVSKCIVISSRKVALSRSRDG